MQNTCLATLTKLFQFQARLQLFLILERMIINTLAFCAFKFDQVILRHICGGVVPWNSGAGGRI